MSDSYRVLMVSSIRSPPYMDLTFAAGWSGDGILFVKMKVRTLLSSNTIALRSADEIGQAYSDGRVNDWYKLEFTTSLYCYNLSLYCWPRGQFLIAILVSSCRSQNSIPRRKQRERWLKVEEKNTILSRTMRDIGHIRRSLDEDKNTKMEIRAALVAPRRLNETKRKFRLLFWSLFDVLVEINQKSDK